ncbi:hypothetical protein RchiOBHm_Chr2g0097251 [Rosa chinensis]|uniref:Uncharacterized protein n=1 Tax=Rosa chinensis TaxID=74649 RepID=A0A2P6RLD6_ROSCH|nr:hypothetical protein RchiOBHm_Chr2g0097251 [Rosa chinensis]
MIGYCEGRETFKFCFLVASLLSLFLVWLAAVRQRWILRML